MSESASFPSLQEALMPLKDYLRLIGVAAALIAVGVGYFAQFSLASIGTALVIPCALLTLQWYALTRAMRPGANGIAWIAGSYPLRIIVIAIGLYVPKLFGVDVRFAAAICLATIVVSMLTEVLVIAKARILAVDASLLSGE